MQEYHKIQTLFKRDLSVPGHPMLEGDWTNEELKYLANLEWEFTEKIDGTNIRVDFAGTGFGVEFGGRTDNAQVPTKLLKYLQGTFQPENFWNAELPALTLYGEGYGAGIQKGGGNYILNAQEFVLFDVVVHGEDQDWWLKRNDVDDIADKLGIVSVPVIGHGTLYDAIDIVKDGLTSEWGDFEAEGIVARPLIQLWNRKDERIICKIKGRDFK